jgi:hypothetical protein
MLLTINLTKRIGTAALNLFLFILYLTTLSVFRNMYRRKLGWLVNNELRRMRKEAIVAQFEVLSWHLPGKVEENLEVLIRDSSSSGRGFNWGSPEYEAGVLPTLPRRSLSVWDYLKNSLAIYQQVKITIRSVSTIELYVTVELQLQKIKGLFKEKSTQNIFSAFHHWTFMLHSKHLALMGKWEMHTKFWYVNLQKRHRLEDMSVDD